MTDPSHELKRVITESLSHLRRLRDEIRVDIHLAGMDAKDQWKALEPRFAAAEAAAHEISEATKAALGGAIEAFQLLKASLRKDLPK